MLSLLIVATGLTTGCGSNAYTAMSRTASGEVSLEAAADAQLDSGARRKAPVEEAFARSPLGTAVERSNCPRSSMGSGTLGARTNSAALKAGELTSAAKVVSPLKARKVQGLRSLACANQSITGAGSTACTLTLGSNAPSGGLTVTLSSDDAALSVPGSVTMPAGASKVSFVATAAAVSATQVANITANAGGSTASFGIQLNAYSPVLSVSSTTISFGAVNVGQTATSAVTLTSSGNAPLTISSISVAGSPFQVTGVAAPLTLNPGQTATLALAFNPDHAGSFTGLATILSDAPAGTATVSMGGSGVAPGVAGLSCSDAVVTGAETDSCVVSLSAPAPTGGVLVSLSSNDTAASVPASTTVPAGASSASFAATIAAVSSSKTASITGTANGIAKSFAIQLNASAPAMTISSTSVAFGSVVVGQTATSSVMLASSGNAPLTISSISVAGSVFKATGVTAPVTLNPGQTATLTLQFYADHTSSFTGGVTIATNAAQGAATINMSANGVPALSGLTCNTGSFTGAGTDSCVVSLLGTAASGGFTVSLTSSNPSVALPASVTVAAGAMSGTFSATLSAVSTSQTATLTATAGAVSKSFTVQLAPASAVLTANAASIPFGSVLINSPAEQQIMLAGSGNAPVTISSVTATGTGFSTSGFAAPLTLNPGQTAVLNVQFTPTAAGSFSGQLAIASNASGGAITIGLSGIGYRHSVQLSWNAPASNAVVGYNVYRAASGTTGYQRVNTGALSATAFSDGNVQSGASYVYYVKSVDGSGAESVASNTTAVSVPTP